MSVLLFLSVLFVNGDAPQKSAAQKYTIYPDGSSEKTTLVKVVEDFIKRDVVFLGEEHDNTVGHNFQLDAIRALHKKRPDIVISMEQFERDTQGMLNDYLKGRMGEADFLKKSRPWKNYKEHYRAIIEFAKENKIDVIASNVPRSIASLISKGKEPSQQEKLFCPRETSAPKDKYWEIFVDVMGSHLGAGEEGAMERFYRSQCCKDDGMAEAITDYLDTHPHRKPLVIHLCGKFHSDYGLGTAQRVLMRKPLLHIGVVTMESVEDLEKVEFKELKDRGHYAVIVPKEKKKKKPTAITKTSGKIEAKK